jgi:hypothetical protein
MCLPAVGLRQSDAGQWTWLLGQLKAAATSLFVCLTNSLGCFSGGAEAALLEKKMIFSGLIAGRS